MSVGRERNRKDRPGNGAPPPDDKPVQAVALPTRIQATAMSFSFGLTEDNEMFAVMAKVPGGEVRLLVPTAVVPAVANGMLQAHRELTSGLSLPKLEVPGR